MKVAHVSTNDFSGGAAKAAYRIHKACQVVDLDSTLVVKKKTLVSADVICPFTSAQLILNDFKYYAEYLIAKKCLSNSNAAIHSLAFFNSHIPKYLNSSDFDIVNLHWVQGGMLSVKNFSQIEKPFVLTVHDMWAFCATEHYSKDDRWKSGYTKALRPNHEKWSNINEWSYKRKVKNWQSNFHIIASSTFMAKAVSESKLFGNYPVSIVPLGIDTDFWAPIDKKIARSILNLDENKPVLIFSSVEGIADKRKGFDLLLKALDTFKNEELFQLILIGKDNRFNNMNKNIKIFDLGFLSDELSLRIAYSAGDVLIAPSRAESFGQIAIEASSCKTPVVSFAIGGFTDIVEHKVGGYLAMPFDHEDLATGINWVLSNTNKHRIGDMARTRTIKYFSSRNTGEQLKKVYDLILLHH